VSKGELAFAERRNETKLRRLLNCASSPGHVFGRAHKTFALSTRRQQTQVGDLQRSHRSVRLSLSRVTQPRGRSRNGRAIRLLRPGRELSLNPEPSTRNGNRSVIYVRRHFSTNGRVPISPEYRSVQLYPVPGLDGSRAELKRVSNGNARTKFC
jgi:hypothetical protein